MSKTDKKKRSKKSSTVEAPLDDRELQLEKEMREVFRNFDTDNSGTVCVRELKHMLQLLGQNPTDAEIKALVEKVDDNKNGQLDFHEFQTLMQGHLKTDDVRQDELRDAFAVFDKDDSGFIDKQELAKVLRSTGEKLSRDEIDTVFNAIDTNGDGQINYEEFCRALKNSPCRFG